MFYLREIYFRFFYLSLSFFITCVLLYFYRTSLITLFSFPLIGRGSFEFSSLVYMHPLELFRSYISTILFSVLYLHIPYLFWNISDFLKPGLSIFEYNRIKTLFMRFVFIFFLINSICFLELLPVIWSFFSAFGTSSGDYGSAGFLFGLRVQDFIIFISDFIGFVSFIAIVFIVLTSLIIFRGVSSLLYWKKLFIFFNIMFATFLSPPDVYSQIVILLTLSIFLEIFIFFFLLSFKVEKKYMLLVRHDVK